MLQSSSLLRLPSSQDSNGAEGPAAKLTHLVLGRIQLVLASQLLIIVMQDAHNDSSLPSTQVTQGERKRQSLFLFIT